MEMRQQEEKNSSLMPKIYNRKLQLNFNQPLSYFLEMEYRLSPPTDPTVPPVNAQQPSQKVEKKMSQQLDFISQFLELPSIQQSHTPHNNSQITEKKQVSVVTSETFERSDSNMENTPREVRLKSIFHNFQKHLVVTLRTAIRIRNVHKRDPVMRLAFQMWQIFTDSHLACKKVLHFLFGVMHLNAEQNYLEARNYALPRAEQLLTSHTPAQLAAAQEYLRGQVIRQGQNVLQRNGLSQRRMQKSDQFQSYFISFLEELQAGPLNRRLPKSEKLQIIKEIQRIRDEQV